MTPLRLLSERTILEQKISRDKVGRLTGAVTMGIGGILCLGGSLSQEEVLAYVGLAKYFLGVGVMSAYHVGINEHRKALEKQKKTNAQ